MKKLLLAGAAAVALAAASPVNAADLRMPVKAPPAMAPAPYFSWSGCYVGAHVGYGWGNKDTTGLGSSLFFTNFLTGNIKTRGEIFGGQLGCNYALANSFVIGIEGSASGANIIGFGQDLEGNFMHAQTDFLASVTGKLGWSGWNPAVLLYVKGGAAWAHDRYQLSYFGGTQDRTGWTVGVGVEWALSFWPNWSAFVEYDHYDFGTKRAEVFCADCSVSSSFVDINQRIDTVRLGLNYRFNVGFLGKAPIAARY
jgi:outer membrane immunogenic protein